MIALNFFFYEIVFDEFKVLVNQASFYKISLITTDVLSQWNKVSLRVLLFTLKWFF